LRLASNLPTIEYVIESNQSRGCRSRPSALIGPRTVLHPPKTKHEIRKSKSEIPSGPSSVGGGEEPAEQAAAFQLLDPGLPAVGARAQTFQNSCQLGWDCIWGREWRVV
jgi:hypothetical protein